MTEEIVGSLQSPSGNLVVVDFGLMGGWSKSVARAVSATLVEGSGEVDALDDGNVVVVKGIGTEPLRVVGVRNGKGRWAKEWKHIELKVTSARTVKTEPIAEVFVERARLMLADPACLPTWKHDGSLDGKADLAFWGRDAQLLAKASGAKRLPSLPDTQEYGFADLPLKQLEKKMNQLGSLVNENEWAVVADAREHDHHHFLLAAARNANGAGDMLLGKARVFGVMSPYGDGRFPVEKCLDASGKLCGVRVVFATKQALTTMELLNPIAKPKARKSPTAENAPKKPKSVPAEARWSPTDNEWELGETDERGRKVGEWRWWLAPKGHLCCQTFYGSDGKVDRYTRFHPDGTISQMGTMRNGKKHGTYTYQRSKKPTEENTIPPEAPANVFKTIVEFKNGEPVSTRAFNDRGQELDLEGNLLA